MKTYRERKQDTVIKNNKKIWKSLGLEKCIKIYGIETVKRALNSWIKYQQENAKIFKEKAKLEARLLEIKSKI